MKVLVSGSTGLIGSALVPYLSSQGHSVVRLVRRAGILSEDEVRWGPENGVLEADALHGVEAAVHLAGESIGGRRWTASQKQRIRDSRVKGTSLLSEALAGLRPKPQVHSCLHALKGTCFENAIFRVPADLVLRKNACSADQSDHAVTLTCEVGHQRRTYESCRTRNQHFHEHTPPEYDSVPNFDTLFTALQCDALTVIID